MTRDPLTVSPDTPILDAAEIMLEKKVSGLPVVQDGKLVGILTESDIFRMLVKSRQRQKPSNPVHSHLIIYAPVSSQGFTELGDHAMNVVDIMTADPKTISSTASLRQAIQLMEDHHFMHLPVLSRQKHLIGIISDRDCRRAINSPYILRERWQDDRPLLDQLDVRSIMSPAPIIVEPYAPATEASRLMLTHNIGCLPVMRAETLIGIVTRSDILAAFMRMSSKIEALTMLTETMNGNP